MTAALGHSVVSHELALATMLRENTLNDRGDAKDDTQPIALQHNAATANTRMAANK